MRVVTGAACVEKSGEGTVRRRDSGLNQFENEI